MMRHLLAGMVLAVAWAGAGHGAIVIHGITERDDWPPLDFVDVGDPLTLTIYNADFLSELQPPGIGQSPFGDYVGRLQLGDHDMVTQWNYAGGFLSILGPRRTVIPVYVGVEWNFDISIHAVTGRVTAVQERVPEHRSAIVWLGLVGMACSVWQFRRPRRSRVGSPGDLEQWENR